MPLATNASLFTLGQPAAFDHFKRSTHATVPADFCLLYQRISFSFMYNNLPGVSTIKSNCPLNTVTLISVVFNNSSTKNIIN